MQPDTVVPDPMDPQSLNRYAYVRNNPLRYTDPTGHCASPANAAAGCPAWMPDIVFGALDLAAALTVMGTAYAPSVDGQPGDLEASVANAEGRWYEGMAFGLVDVVDHADTANRCLSEGCSAVAVGLALLPGVGGRADRVFTKLGGQISAKLTSGLKDRFRDEARNFLKAVNPEKLDIHHRLPLEWAHLFPELDPNRPPNLVGLSASRHAYVGSKWTEFRARLKGRTPTPDEVLDFMRQMDREIEGFPQGDVVLPR